MTMGFIQPTLSVLEDRRVTTGELGWYLQELMLVIITATLMTTAVKLTEETLEGRK